MGRFPGPFQPLSKTLNRAPFPGLRPHPGKAAEVAAPPYDVLDSNEARERAKGKPWSFLHISKPEIDLPPGTAAAYSQMLLVMPELQEWAGTRAELKLT